MIAIDLDGTLLSPDATVTPRTKAAVHRALEAGLLICFATGRNWTESKMVLEAVEHYDSAVFVGGAMVVDTAKEVVLHRMLMDASLAREVCRILEDHDQCVLALQDTSEVGFDYLISAEIEPNPETARWMQVTSALWKRAEKLSRHGHEHTVRVGIVAPPDQVAVARASLERLLGERVLLQSIAVPAFGIVVLEVFDPSVNKWQGLLKVAERHGIKPSEIIAVGDDVNDLAMIRHAGLGVAMGNARDEVKAIAARVIAPNHEEGLAQFLDELVESKLVLPEVRRTAI